MAKQPDIVVVADSDSPAGRRAAEALARRLGLRLGTCAKPQAADGTRMILGLGEERLELRGPDDRPGRGLFVDFSTLHPRQAARRGGFSHKQPLARAIGKTTTTVLDATAGLGHDAALLACMGYEVIAVERSPIIAALLEDGLRRAELNPELRAALGGRMTLLHDDARHVLQQGLIAPDAVYIDPMFPPKRKASALAKKSIRLVRQIVGEDEDAPDLLATARQHAPRVVVKRPTYAPPLSDEPASSISGKLVRYDIYVGT